MSETAVQYATATIQFSRKNGLPNYSNEEFGTFLQVPLVGAEGQPLTEAKEIEALLDEQTAFLKAWVYKQIGTSFDVDPQSGVVVGAVPVETAKPAARKGGYAAKKPAARATTTDADKELLWQRVASAELDGKFWRADGETIWDNREGKRNPKSPDFKFADSGEGLWLSDAPDWFVGIGEGI